MNYVETAWVRLLSNSFSFVSMAAADGIASFLTRVNLCIELNQQKNQDDPEGTLGMSFKDKIPVQKIVGPEIRPSCE